MEGKESSRTEGQICVGQVCLGSTEMLATAGTGGWGCRTEGCRGRQDIEHRNGSMMSKWLQGCSGPMSPLKGEIGNQNQCLGPK